MSGSSEKPWSDGPNAPQIPPSLYLAEKEFFAGQLIGAISYGIVIALFFQCIGVLLSPANPIRRGTKWGLVAHTVAMFSFLTIPTGIDLKNKSMGYINNRNFPGNDEYPFGPFGYEALLSDPKVATSTVFACMFPLNQWLADGLLLHRCYVIYSMNYWAMAFPCLLYLASFSMGVVYICQVSTISDNADATINFATSYFLVSLSLNIILTLMIVTRLILHRRNLRKAIGVSDSSGGPYTTIIAMLIGSCAPYVITFLMYVVPWEAGSLITLLFCRLLSPVQVIAPYLIIIRVANRRASTSDTISGAASPICFRSQWTTDGDGTLVDGNPVHSMEVNTEVPSGLGSGVENAIEEVSP